MTTAAVTSKEASLREIFLAFLRLGLASFGGPIAHLGYFRSEFVVRRRWLDDKAYGDLVALCQFLPGPASSQVCFSLGLLRGNGLLGGVAASLAFTLPSALVLFAFAMGSGALAGPAAAGALHGLKLVAVAVVAQAIWGMARTLTPDRERAAIALAAVAMVSFIGGSVGQLAAIILGAVAGPWFCRNGAGVTGHTALAFPVSRRGGAIALAIFAGLLALMPLLAELSGIGAIKLFDAFYRSGALVFGGGHVVLPLLRAAVVQPGWVSNETFLSGYGLAQAVPGPLFTFSAYLGALASPAPDAWVGASIALAAIFLPGLLLVYGTLPFWDALRRRPMARAVLSGTNAAVVGILGAALYNPLWTSAVLDPGDFVLALAGFLLLTVWRIPSWSAVLLLAIAEAIRALI